MDLESDITESSFSTLLEYKEMAKNPINHLDMVKDKTTLHFLAYVLDSKDSEVLETSLDTIELLCQSSENVVYIKKTFGVVQSLESLVLNENINKDLKVRTKEILELINKSASPVGTSNRTSQAANFQKILTLHIHGLHEETQKDLEETLTKQVKGVLAVLVDVEHQRCIVTVHDHVDPKLLAKAIAENTKMEARLVSRNKFNQEILISLSEDEPSSVESEELPPYLDEKESPVQEKAVNSMKEMRIAASEWFAVAAGILQKSLYW